MSRVPPSVAVPRSGVSLNPGKPRFRGTSHLLAFVSALTLAPLVIVSAPGIGPRFVIALYAVAIVGLFGVSALYHRRDWGDRGYAVMRRLDHSMIFVAIAGTYTPIALFALPSSSARLVLLVVWIGAIVGIIGRVAWTEAPYPVIAAPYVAVGWACVLVVGDMWRALGVAGFVLLLVGGVLYTIGAGIYAIRRPDPWPLTFGYHEVFHLFVIGGAAVHYVAVAFIALPKA
ncbi:MAG: hemolysin III family protein [Acidimicrobiia bacterium]|nr:hemolysin III family protein [Acidimicrobiia bacterium]